MTDTKKKFKSYITPEGRCAFIALSEPRANDESKPDVLRYGLNLLFAVGTNLAPLHEFIMGFLLEKFEAADRIPRGINNPIIDIAKRQAEGKMEYDDFLPGMFCIRPTAKLKPGIVGPDVQPILDTSQIYSGMYGRCEINAFWYENKGNKGVGFGLLNFQKTRDGEPMGNRRRPEDAFSPVEGASSGGAPINSDSVFV